ncbi:uncharacterized protein CCOS01_04809 [Colletotrichum costaricense]|uniref:Uncharacterized protein n=1 Tax=Colletotrichum costaricense TaxID=1209916 RepID=A0AAI9Z3E2_9PEZI|nr:uncharacterized protein CCOS01_04809 [Colletotrichum costaricense]KAK1532826.1 hypothetical protein CCOS01_04809 [Colletotrichum costaricense]
MRHPTAATGQSVATASCPFLDPRQGQASQPAAWEGPKIGLCHSVVTQWREIVYHVDQDSANISWPTFASLVVPYAFAALLLIIDARLRMAWWHPHPTPVHLSSSTVLLGEVESPCEGA